MMEPLETVEQAEVEEVWRRFAKLDAPRRQRVLAYLVLQWSMYEPDWKIAPSMLEKLREMAEPLWD